MSRATRNAAEADRPCPITRRCWSCAERDDCEWRELQDFAAARHPDEDLWPYPGDEEAGGLELCANVLILDGVPPGTRGLKP